jgi:toluene monooxygenase system protein E
VDSARSNAWTSALVAYAVAQRAGNRSVLDNWMEKWRPAAERAAGVLKEVLP